MTIEAFNKDKSIAGIRDKMLEGSLHVRSLVAFLTYESPIHGICFNRQFASLCANAGLRRQEFHMYRRALADGDHEMVRDQIPVFHFPSLIGTVYRLPITS